MRSPGCARRARRPRATPSRSGGPAGRPTRSCAISWIRSPSPAPTPGARRRAISRSPRRRVTRSTWTTRSRWARPAGGVGGGGVGGGGGWAGIRLAPAAVRFHSGLAGDEGSRLTYAVPVARVADSGLAPALSRNRVWRNSGGLDFLLLRGLQLRVDAASVRDLRD